MPSIVYGAFYLHKSARQVHAPAFLTPELRSHGLKNILTAPYHQNQEITAEKQGKASPCTGQWFDTTGGRRTPSAVEAWMELRFVLFCLWLWSLYDSG